MFVSESFLQEVKTPPFFWIGPELARRICAGHSPVLANSELRKANARGGLNSIGWHGAARSDQFDKAEILNALFDVFIQLHRGYLIRELIGQADSLDMAHAMCNVMNSCFDPQLRDYVDCQPGWADEMFHKPHVLGATRERALARAGLWGTALFSYHPPQFSFRRSEQRLLTASLQGATDEELSQQLDISLSSVKRLWLSIYGRVASSMPELLREHSSFGDGSVRGKGKKQRVLAYVREHPEELRPTVRKLLANAARR